MTFNVTYSVDFYPEYKQFPFLCQFSDICSAQPCFFGGTCLLLDNDDYRCVCPPGTTGRNCETNFDDCARSTRCQHNGECVDGLNSHTCNCNGTGYTGDNCTQEVNECESGKICGRGGRCMNLEGDFKCICYAGLRGRFCERDGIYTIAESTFAKLVLFFIFVAVCLCIAIGLGAYRTFFAKRRRKVKSTMNKTTQTPPTKQYDIKVYLRDITPTVTDSTVEESGYSVYLDPVTSEEYVMSDLKSSMKKKNGSAVLEKDILETRL